MHFPPSDTTLYAPITPAMQERITADITKHMPPETRMKIYERNGNLFFHAFIYDKEKEQLAERLATPVQISAVIQYDRALDLYELTLAEQDKPLRDFVQVYHDRIGSIIFQGLR